MTPYQDQNKEQAYSCKSAAGESMTCMNSIVKLHLEVGTQHDGWLRQHSSVDFASVSKSMTLNDIPQMLKAAIKWRRTTKTKWTTYWYLSF